MKIGIVGAGFTGLSAAYTLIKSGHDVTIFERDAQPGGLAVGYQEKGWEWMLEKHYHHWFTNDTFVLNLAREISYPVTIKRPKTSVFVNDSIVQLDSLKAFLTFPQLTLIDRLRMTIALGSLRISPFWKPLEKVKALDVLPKAMGRKAWDMLWDPQLSNKMGEYAKDISLVWFWTRINKRTPSLAYPDGGFLSFANALVATIEKKGGTIHFNTETTKIEDTKQTKISFKKNDVQKTQVFDKIIVTLPSYLFLKLTPSLPEDYTQKLVKLKGLSATNMVLRMKKPFLTDGTYWLSICKRNSPIMALVEHTNFMDKKHYNNEHLLYIGNYATTDDKLDWDKKRLLAFYNQFLQKIHPGYDKNLIAYELFKAPFAQPIVPTNYSKLVPKYQTPLPHVFLANIEQVYPWDRGTNYAVELGITIAKIVTETT